MLEKLLHLAYTKWCIVIHINQLFHWYVLFATLKQSRATLYGCKHEDEAVDKYRLVAVQKHKNLKITPADLVLKCQKACFGASPDSYVECDCCGLGVLEAKCPYCAQDKGFEELVENHDN